MYYCVNIRLHLFIYSPTDEKIRLCVFCSDYKQCCYGHSSPYLLVHVCVRVSVGAHLESGLHCYNGCSAAVRQVTANK